MPETLRINSIDQPDEAETPRYTPEQTEALRRAEEYLRGEVPTLQKVTGLPVEAEIGTGWATNPDTGKVTIDPSFFLERGYSEEHCVYATLHELMAHLRDILRDPVYNARQKAFESRSKADFLFNNILTDIHGNRYTHTLFPAQADVGADIYSTRLFPVERDGEPVDYTAQPLHVQFMYKMICQLMDSDRDMAVRPEVDTALESLRDYKGTGTDIIELLTRPGLRRKDIDPAHEKASEKLPGSDRFDLQLAVIYPVYRRLLEQAREEHEQQKQQQGGESGESGEQADDNKSSEGQQSEASENQNGESQPSDETSNENGSGDPFDDAYNDYFENKHPEPFSEEQEKQLDDMIKKAAREARESQQQPNPERELDKTLRRETGHGLREHHTYQTEVEKHRRTIDAMRDVYRSVIAERVAMRRGLSRRSYAEGDLLHPDRLAQTVIDIKSHVREPEAFTRYEHIRGRTEMVGKTDYIFAFDRSSSMSGNRAQSAATTALIMLEALAGMERDIKQAEEEHGIELDLDIRTALYTFNNKSTCLKSLSSGLSDRERLDVQSAVTSPSGGTADHLSLTDIATLPRESDRKRIVFVITDGESNDKAKASTAIQRLRDADVTVIGIGIESDAATHLYAPFGRRVDNPEDLPDVLQSYIESTMK